MYLKICEIDPVKFLSALGLAWLTALKKTRVKLYLLTDVDMLLLVEKVLEQEYLTLFVIDKQKLITNT